MSRSIFRFSQPLDGLSPVKSGQPYFILPTFTGLILRLLRVLLLTSCPRLPLSPFPHIVSAHFHGRLQSRGFPPIRSLMLCLAAYAPNLSQAFPLQGFKRRRVEHQSVFHTSNVFPLHCLLANLSQSIFFGSL